MARSPAQSAVTPAPAPASGPLADFLRHLRTERRLSPHTVLNYERDVRALIALTGETPLAELQPHDVRRCVAQLHARGLAGRSLARMLSAWRGFYRYLARDHGYTGNPCNGLRAPRSPKTLPHALSPDEANRLAALPAEDALAVRDRAVIELFYSSGLRLSELAGLDLGSVDRQDATVRVLGKGNKSRIVPVGRQALAALEAWLAQRAVWLKDKGGAAGGEALFINRGGARLSARSIQYRLKQWGLKLGLADRVHPHMLRHSFASHVLQSSGDLRAVQEMLGHASISTTQVYTHLDFQYLAKTYDAAHPRARKKTP